ncbi:hypothetical protein N7535_001374 [Penicillium sp. DV-2018c]|nr:hypothetical protein N7461_005382 [Penicillium sp. DV-2018c]KAJ5582754.1 hypothetical protein N7535_001374 [Penicillium sp. DV-2018c]
MYLSQQSGGMEAATQPASQPAFHLNPLVKNNNNQEHQSNRNPIPPQAIAQPALRLRQAGSRPANTYQWE